MALWAAAGAIWNQRLGTARPGTANRHTMLPTFHEEQRFDWFWSVAVMIPAVIVAYGLYRQIWLGRPIGPSMVIWSAFVVTVVVAVWIWQMKLLTDVRDDGLSIRFVRLWPDRTIPWSQIRKAEVFTYRPIKDYGGWGVRWAARGIVYHARGHRGVRMELVSGERVLVGSQRSEELARAIWERAGLAAPAT